jgi:sulfatase maturation enzyme AslB (radical SAM superfamily)
MCGPELSTKWYSDYKQLFNKQYKGISKQDYSKLDVSKLNYLKLLGGEPLMEQDTIISLLSRSNLSQLSVMITTNGTILPNEELLNLLKKCKKVFWIVSIDSFGAMNNFLRKDSDWNIVDFNLKYLNKQFPKSVKVQSVCSVYNCNLMDKLADYLRNEGILQQIVIVDNTDLFFECMRPNILPDVIRNKILENISDINIKNILTDEFQKNNFSLRNLEYFLKVDDQLNKVRKEHWKELNPWLWEEITQFMKEEQKNETRI